MRATLGQQLLHGLIFGQLAGLVFGAALGNPGLGIALGQLFGLAAANLVYALRQRVQHDE